MRINRKTEIAISFVKYLETSLPKTVEHYSKETGESSMHVDQVARQLRLSGLIRSVRGPGGGYIRTDNISVLDVFQCLNKSDVHTNKEMLAISAKVDAVLRNINI